MIRLALAALLLGPTAAAAQSVAYDLSFPNAAHHEAEIAVTFSGATAGALVVHMSRSSPGRYAVHDFAKNVYRLRAEGAGGKALAVEPLDPSTWRVATDGGAVTVRYTLFGDRTGGTYTGIDPTHAHLNMPATLLWADGFDERPVTLTFHPADPSWRIATQLVPTGQPTVFTAPGLQYLMDSPTEIGPLTVREWTVPGAAGPKTLRLTVHHDGTDAEVDAYAKLAQAIVAEEKQVFGELAPYDHGTYTFLADYRPTVNGDGMEHRNSTIITSSRSLAGSPVDLANTLAHEFFHSWNVERMRPKSLEPFDFTRANPSGELWFAEGFTNYYGNLLLRRARVQSEDRWSKGLGSTLTSVLGGPGRQLRTAVEMSRQAPFVDAATSIDPTSFGNTYVSYYPFGEVIALGLDLTLRTRLNRTLDGFMRAVWTAHPDVNQPYTTADLRRHLADFSGNPAFADSIFSRYIEGHEAMDYRALLGRAGFTLRRAHLGRASLGPERLMGNAAGLIVGSQATVGSPLYAAGLDRGDTLRLIAGQRVTTTAELDTLLAHHRIGEKLPVAYAGRAGQRETTITLAEDAALEVVPNERAGVAVTPEMLALRSAWLDSKVPAAEHVAIERFCTVCRRAFPFETSFCPFDGTALSLTLPPLPAPPAAPTPEPKPRSRRR